MDVLDKRDWFTVGAVVPLLGVLFSSAFGLFAGPAMSPQVENLWIMGIIVIAFLVWLNAAKTQQREREARQRELEAKEHERVALLRFDEIKQLLAKPGTTLEDVVRVIGDQAHFEGRIVDRESSNGA